MKTWLDPIPIPVPDALREHVGGHPVIAQSLVRRGFDTPAAASRFLDSGNYTPAPPDDLPDMDKAVIRLQHAIAKQQPILVWGDFDVDGQTSTALLVAALRDMRANVVYHIPNRFREGHGIHLPTLKTLLDGGIDLLLTCDTGIAAHESVAYAQSRGIDVIITDHHTLPETLPAAYAAINPMRLREGHPLRELPGVGTAYQLIRALYGSTPSDHLLDLVALGIVADVMVQVDDTRYWLQRGLDVLRNAPRPGIAALLERAAIDPADLTESDLGFTIAPRLNALGRLADANPAVDLLTTSDHAVITERVNELEGLNQKRRFYTRQVLDAAKQQIDNDAELLKYAALVVKGDGWHTGVAGIVASRLVEDYQCPVIVLSDNEGIASGSARSIAGCNIVEAIGSQAHLLNHYGGHTMAAGLSLPVEHVYEFRRGISRYVRERLGTETVQPQLQIDAYLSLAEIDLNFAEDIARLAPFGNGNPPLILATRSVRVKSRRAMGSRGDHLDLRIVDDDGHEQRVIWWFGDLDAVPIGAFDIAYTVRPNVFNGKREALIEWLDARVSDDAAVTLDDRQVGYRVIDQRQTANPAKTLRDIQSTHSDVLIWREGVTDVEGVDRLHLHEAGTLVVWTIPPDVHIWQAALNIVQPQTLILFAHSPTQYEQPDQFLQYLAGLVKYAYNHKGGQILVSDIAALTGHTEQTITLGLKWLAASTPFAFTPLSDDVYQIDMTHTTDDALKQRLAERLQAALNETRAYRLYWRQQAF